MIICIGEILADMICDKSSCGMMIKSYLGGASINVCANVKYCGAKAGFIGCVGNDVIGKYLVEETNKLSLDYLDVSFDKYRNTTLAFVSLDNGERDFTFFRNDTADYHIAIDSLESIDLNEVCIIYLGSLMLNTDYGYNLAKEIVDFAKKNSILISFDINLRMDLYDSVNTAKERYSYFIEQCDIVKFSEDELLLFSDKCDLFEAINSYKKDDQLLLVTLGSKGSFYSFNEYSNFVKSDYVSSIDTTGAGDAFLGAVLSCLDLKTKASYTKTVLDKALAYGNKIGSIAVRHYGAISHITNK